MLEGGWESGKVRCMEDDGKGKEKKKRGSRLFLILIVHLCLLFFLLLIFLLKCARKASAEERAKFLSLKLAFYTYIII